MVFARDPLDAHVPAQYAGPEFVRFVQTVGIVAHSRLGGRIATFPHWHCEVRRHLLGPRNYWAADATYSMKNTEMKLSDAGKMIR